MRITCPWCGAGLQAPESAVGQKGPCKKCGKVLVVLETGAVRFGEPEIEIAPEASPGPAPASVTVQEMRRAADGPGLITPRWKCPVCQAPMPPHYRSGRAQCPGCGRGIVLDEAGSRLERAEPSAAAAAGQQGLGAPPEFSPFARADWLEMTGVTIVALCVIGIIVNLALEFNAGSEGARAADARMAGVVNTAIFLASVAICAMCYGFAGIIRTIAQRRG